MSNMHPMLAALLGAYRDGLMTQIEYEQERQRILTEELGIGGEDKAFAPHAPVPTGDITIASPAAIRAQEAARVASLQQKARESGLVRDFVPKAVQIPRVARSVMGPDGEVRLRDPAEVAAEEKALRLAFEKATAAHPAGKVAPPLVASGHTIKRGILTPVTKTVPLHQDPRVLEIRRRHTAGELTEAEARSAIAALKPMVATGSRTNCPICQGGYASAPRGSALEGIGRQCLCGGKGFLSVDVQAAENRALRGANAADPLPENPEAIRYIAWDQDGRAVTISADTGQKALAGAVDNLSASGRTFIRAEFPDGAVLTLPEVRQPCSGCRATGVQDGRSCAVCHGERQTIRYNVRIYFGDDPEGNSGLQQAHEAGLLSLTGPDPSRQCGRERCKGPECRHCENARQGGYQRPAFLRCGGCHGRKRTDDGETCGKCRGKGFVMTTEILWCQGTFTVSKELRRGEILSAQITRKRDRNISVQIGPDTVEVGPGAIPSRKSGAFEAKRGTARNRFDTARAKPDGIGIWRREPSDSRHATSKG